VQTRVLTGARHGRGDHGERCHHLKEIQMSATTEQSGATAIRSFHVEFPDEALQDLRHSIAAARWPTKELVEDRSQGVRLAMLRALAEYWMNDYDWRRCEARLNALPQFKTEIDGVDVHFIHVKSRHEEALPLIMTHGWPGSVIEMLDTVGLLTDPTEHGGRAEDAFDLVLPSVPGYGSPPSRPRLAGTCSARHGPGLADPARVRAPVTEGRGGDPDPVPPRSVDG
jgi:hypothetical protein